VLQQSSHLVLKQPKIKGYIKHVCELEHITKIKCVTSLSSSVSCQKTVMTQFILTTALLSNTISPVSLTTNPDDHLWFTRSLPLFRCCFNSDLNYCINVINSHASAVVLPPTSVIPVLLSASTFLTPSSVPAPKFLDPTVAQATKGHVCPHYLKYISRHYIPRRP